MKIEDLLQITLDDAVELSKGQKGRSVVANWGDAHYLQDLEIEYKKTCNPAIILEAVFVCAMNGFKLPEWLQTAFIKAYRKVRHYKIEKNSWDEAFGKPFPKKTHIGANQEKRENKYKIYYRIKELHESGTPIDEKLFSRVGREFAIGGKSKINKIYYEIENERKNFSK